MYGQKWRTSGYHYVPWVSRSPVSEVGVRGGAKSKAEWVTNLVHDVFERVRAVNGKTDKDEVRLGVRQRPQSVVFLLSGRIPKRQLNDLAGGRVYGIGDVVLEYCRDIFLSRVVVSNQSAHTR